MEDVVNTWNGRRVFITGHTGFKGGWLALWLAYRGAIVRGFGLPPETNPSMFSSAQVSHVVDSVEGDIRDFEHLRSSLTEFAPEIVFHLAAQPLVRRSYFDPLSTYAINVMGTAHVLEAVRGAESVRAVVCVTTDKCYENHEWVWPYRETDRLGGHDPYSSSKACAEILSAAYHRSFLSVRGPSLNPVALCTARAGNVIGGGDWSEDRLLPDLIRGLQSKRPVLIRHSKAVRPWQHVLDPLYGYILLAERLLHEPSRTSGAFNFGPSESDLWTVEQIANLAVAKWGGDTGWTTDSNPTVHEAHVLRLDSSRARSELQWKPKLTTEAALDWTIDWYRTAAECSDMSRETVRQIERYEKI